MLQTWANMGAHVAPGHLPMLLPPLHLVDNSVNIFIYVGLFVGDQ